MCVRPRVGFMKNINYLRLKQRFLASSCDTVAEFLRNEGLLEEGRPVSSLGDKMAREVKGWADDKKMVVWEAQQDGMARAREAMAREWEKAMMYANDARRMGIIRLAAMLHNPDTLEELEAAPHQLVNILKYLKSEAGESEATGPGESIVIKIPANGYEPKTLPEGNAQD